MYSVLVYVNISMIDKPLGGLNMTEIPSVVILAVFDVQDLHS